jgi:hypothetical protein
MEGSGWLAASARKQVWMESQDDEGLGVCWILNILGDTVSPSMGAGSSQVLVVLSDSGISTQRRGPPYSVCVSEVKLHRDWSGSSSSAMAPSMSSEAYSLELVLDSLSMVGGRL